MFHKGVIRLSSCLQGLKGKSAMKAFLDALVEGGKHIQNSSLGLPTLVAQIFDQSAKPASASKKKADPTRYCNVPISEDTN